MGYTIIKNGNQYSILENGKYGYNKLYTSNKDMNLLGTDIRAGDFFKVIKNNDGSKRALLTRRVNPGNSIETALDYIESLNWIKEYINSKGFKQRFNNTQLPNDIRSIQKPLILKYPKLIIKHNYNTGTGAMAHYDRKNHVITKAYTFPYKMIHEVAHWLDDILVPDRKWKLDGEPYSRNNRTVTYSSLFPQLRDNVYNLVYNYKNIGPLNWNLMGNYEHDARPTELYANLIAFRKFLLDNNIYDSFKSNNPFNQELLNKVKILPNIPDHILNFINLYDDDKLINIMNTVAYNLTSNNNLNLQYYV